MAILTGISGLQMGDGQGGKIALDINRLVTRILEDNELSYLTATVKTPGQLRAHGTVHYDRPEIIGASDYGNDGTGAFDVPQVGAVRINIDKARKVKMEYETFDVARLADSSYILGMIATGIAMAVQADLNANFLTFLKDAFETNGELANKPEQVIKLEYVGHEQVAIDTDAARSDFKRLENKVIRLGQKYDKRHLGINKAEIHSIVSPFVDANLKDAFWNQPSQLGTFVIKGTLVGQTLGRVKYTTENMLDLQIAAGTSFSKDKALDLKNIIGFMFHNEAIAMPVAMDQVSYVINPENGNPRFIQKYMYGIGFVRPELVIKITQDPKRMSREEKKEQKLFDRANKEALEG